MSEIRTGESSVNVMERYRQVLGGNLKSRNVESLNLSGTNALTERKFRASFKVAQQIEQNENLPNEPFQLPYITRTFTQEGKSVVQVDYAYQIKTKQGGVSTELRRYDVLDNPSYGVDLALANLLGLEDRVKEKSYTEHGALRFFPYNKDGQDAVLGPGESLAIVTNTNDNRNDLERSKDVGKILGTAIVRVVEKEQVLEKDQPGEPVVVIKFDENGRPVTYLKNKPAGDFYQGKPHVKYIELKQQRDNPNLFLIREALKENFDMFRVKDIFKNAKSPDEVLNFKLTNRGIQVVAHKGVKELNLGLIDISSLDNMPKDQRNRIVEQMTETMIVALLSTFKEANPDWYQSRLKKLKQQEQSGKEAEDVMILGDIVVTSKLSSDKKGLLVSEVDTIQTWENNVAAKLQEWIQKGKKAEAWDYLTERLRIKRLTVIYEGDAWSSYFKDLVFVVGQGGKEAGYKQYLDQIFFVPGLHNLHQKFAEGLKLLKPESVVLMPFVLGGEQVQKKDDALVVTDSQGNTVYHAKQLTERATLQQEVLTEIKQKIDEAGKKSDVSSLQILQKKLSQVYDIDEENQLIKLYLARKTPRGDIKMRIIVLPLNDKNREVAEEIKNLFTKPKQKAGEGQESQVIEKLQVEDKTQLGGNTTAEIEESAQWEGQVDVLDQAQSLVDEGLELKEGDVVVAPVGDRDKENHVVDPEQKDTKEDISEWISKLPNNLQNRIRQVIEAVRPPQPRKELVARAVVFAEGVQKFFEGQDGAEKREKFLQDLQEIEKLAQLDSEVYQKGNQVLVQINQKKTSVLDLRDRPFGGYDYKNKVKQIVQAAQRHGGEMFLDDLPQELASFQTAAKEIEELIKQRSVLSHFESLVQEIAERGVIPEETWRVFVASHVTGAKTAIGFEYQLMEAKPEDLQVIVNDIVNNINKEYDDQDNDNFVSHVVKEKLEEWDAIGDELGQLYNALEGDVSEFLQKTRQLIEGQAKQKLVEAFVEASNVEGTDDRTELVNIWQQAVQQLSIYDISKIQRAIAKLMSNQVNLEDLEREERYALGKLLTNENTRQWFIEHFIQPGEVDRGHRRLTRVIS